MPFDLRGEYFETIAPKHTSGSQLRDRQGRCDGEVVTRMQSDGLTDDPEIAIEVFELTAHADKPARERPVIACIGIRT